MELSLTGVITRIVHESPFGGAIFLVRSNHSASAIRTIGDYRNLPNVPIIGEVWGFIGQYKVHPGYGKQFHISYATRQVPDGCEVVELFTHHPLFIDLGRKYAKRLWKKYGGKLFDILNGADLSSLRAAGLYSESAIKLIESWASYCTLVKVTSFFSKSDLPLDLVEPSIKMWGHLAPMRLEQNPYLLALFTKWIVIDAVMRKRADFDEANHNRLKSACVAILDDELLRRHKDTMPVLKLQSRLLHKLGNIDLVNKAILLSQTEPRCLYIDKTKTTVQSRGMVAIKKALKSRINEFSQNVVDETDKPALQVESVEQENGELLIRSLRTNKLTVALAWPLQGILFTQKYLIENALHILPSESFRSIGQFNSSSKAVLLGELLSRTVDLPKQHQEFIFIHGANLLDDIAVHKLFSLFQKNSKVCLIGEMRAASPPGPGRFFQHIASTTRSEALMILRDRNHHKLSPEDLAEQFCSLSSGHESKLLRLRLETRFLHADSATQLTEFALQSYREFSEQGTTQIVTEKWRTAHILNLKLQKEFLELRVLQKLPTPRIRLFSNVEATIGDLIVYRGRNYSKGILLGATGKIVEILMSPLLEIDIQGNLIKVAAKAHIDMIGLVSLTAEECKQFMLGYAIVPLLGHWSLLDNLILCLEGTNSIDRRSFDSLAARALKSFSLIGTRGRIESIVDSSRTK